MTSAAVHNCPVRPPVVSGLDSTVLPIKFMIGVSAAFTRFPNHWSIACSTCPGMSHHAGPEEVDPGGLGSGCGAGRRPEPPPFEGPEPPPPGPEPEPSPGPGVGFGDG